jgi:hypothetical protein
VKRSNPSGNDIGEPRSSSVSPTPTIPCSLGVDADRRIVADIAAEV